MLRPERKRTFHNLPPSKKKKKMEEEEQLYWQSNFWIFSYFWVEYKEISVGNIAIVTSLILLCGPSTNAQSKLKFDNFRIEILVSHIIYA